MNLLPKSHEEFSQKEYWDSFFKKRGNKAFEWYGEYPELAEHLHKYIKQQDDILITGCGNSTIGRDLYDIGYLKITNIDISQVVIRQMLSQSEKHRPNLKYIQMNALKTSFANEEFSVILDKGTLDALMPDNKPETLQNISKYFNEIQRLLKTGGRYICISLLQEQILKILLDYFPKKNFMFRAVRCYEAEKKAMENNENSMPVFMVICTKFKQLPREILELNLTSGSKMQRYEKISEVVEQIVNVQHAAFVCSGLKRSTVENEVSLDLFQAGSSLPRFTVYVVDDAKPEVRNTQYAAFIVPQGREAEWLFSSKTGRLNLLKMTKTNRLAIVTMHRNEEYGDFEQVQAELSEAVCSLAPTELRNKKIPFFSLGSDVGKRTVQFRGNSKFSGDYIVEDVEIDGENFRRLFYLDSQLVIQSEAKLKSVKTKKGIKLVVDLAYLTCKHHIYMSIAASLVKSESKSRIAVIGLGGGGLCSFLRKFLAEIEIVAVDIDEDMLKVASEWFGLVQNEKLRVVIQDGCEFLQKCEKFNAVLFDVDSKDSKIGMSCPPQQFLENSVLDNVVRVISGGGYFVLNLVLRDETLRPGILVSLRKKFKRIVSYKLSEDLNEIFVCTNSEIEGDALKGLLKQGSIELNAFFKRNKCESLEIEEYLNGLRICE